MAETGQGEIVGTIVELSSQATAGTGIEIAEVQLRGAGKARLLRIYIDKLGGVTHADCELVSQRVGQLLDESDVIPEEGYTLEVSSLGPDRKLVTARDFERVVGQSLALTLRPLEGSSARNRLEGKLLKVADDRIELETPEGGPVMVPLDQIGKAKLKYRF